MGSFLQQFCSRLTDQAFQRPKNLPKFNPCQSGLHRPCPVSLSVGSMDLWEIEEMRMVRIFPLYGVGPLCTIRRQLLRTGILLELD